MALGLFVGFVHRTLAMTRADLPLLTSVAPTIVHAAPSDRALDELRQEFPLETATDPAATERARDTRTATRNKGGEHGRD